MATHSSAGYQRRWRADNLGKVAEYNRVYREKHLEKITESQRKYRVDNREKIAKYNRERRVIDPVKRAESQRIFRAKHPERGAEASKRFRERNPERIVEYKRKFRAKHLGREVEYERKARQKNPIRFRCGEILHYAVRMGRIEKPDVCSRCTSTVFIEGHHKDYSKPLDVDWLCKKCHRIADKERRENDRNQGSWLGYRKKDNVFC